MSALRFARVIANSVQECAPDHSAHIIGVGELREAVAEMEALYEALLHVEEWFAVEPTGRMGPAETAVFRKLQDIIDAALAQARGDLVDPLEQVAR